MQTLQQERAKNALKEVTNWKEKTKGKENEEKRRKLKARTSELPFMIHANGLGQAVAFFKSKSVKKDEGYDEVFRALQSWMSQSKRPFAGQTDLMEAIVNADLRTYRVAQAEAMAYMDWVKKFASAYLSDQA